MKRLLFVLFAISLLGGVCGCLRDRVVSNGDENGGPCVPCARRACWPPCGGCLRGGAQREGPALAPQQPPVAAVTYPYYTLRGPRDFLQRTPSPIGP